MLRNPDYKHSNVMHNFSWHPLYSIKSYTHEVKINETIWKLMISL